MQRCFTNIMSADVSETSQFYEFLLGMTRQFSADWFISLVHPDRDGMELGIIQRDHPIVPEALRGKPCGVMLTFVVADCDDVHTKAEAMGAEIVEPPRDMPYGQRRMLLRDPEGTVVDISAPTARMTS